MTWIITATGRRFDLLTPLASQVSAVDIAHALSNLCRFNGHSKRHYSVAQHSLLVARILEEDGEPAEVVLAGLLHDATEAYVGDMVRPLKLYLRDCSLAGFGSHQSDYDQVEDVVWRAICDHFGLSYKLPDSVKRADMIALGEERRELLPDHPTTWECLAGIKPRGYQLESMTPTATRQAFHDRLLQLHATTHRRASA